MFSLIQIYCSSSSFNLDSPNNLGASVESLEFFAGIRVNHNKMEFDNFFVLFILMTKCLTCVVQFYLHVDVFFKRMIKISPECFLCSLNAKCWYVPKLCSLFLFGAADTRGEHGVREWEAVWAGGWKHCSYPVSGGVLLALHPVPAAQHKQPRWGTVQRKTLFSMFLDCNWWCRRKAPWFVWFSLVYIPKFRFDSINIK